MRPFVSLLLLALLIPATASLADNPPAGPGDSYLALGDSLATGTEAPGNNDDQPGYPALVAEQLLATYPGLTVENLGRDGETSSTLLSDGQLAAAEAFIASEQAAGRCVGLVTLGIGGNDAITILLDSSVDGAVVLERFEQNLDSVLNRLQAALSAYDTTCQSDLVLMDYYNPFPGLEFPGRGKLADTWMPAFNTVISTTAAAYGVPVAPVAVAFAGNESTLTYVNPEIYTNPALFGNQNNLDYHPRPAGHAAIARQLLAASGYLADDDNGGNDPPPDDPDTPPEMLFLPLLPGT